MSLELHQRQLVCLTDGSPQHFIHLQHCPGRIRRMAGPCLLSAFNYIAHFSYALPRSETPIQTQTPTHAQVSELEPRTQPWMLTGHKQRAPFLFMAVATVTNTSVYNGLAARAAAHSVLMAKARDSTWIVNAAAKKRNALKICLVMSKFWSGTESVSRNVL